MGSLCYRFNTVFVPLSVSGAVWLKLGDDVLTLWGGLVWARFHL